MSSVRNAPNRLGYDWRGLRIGGPEASMRGLWPVLILAALLVFGCFFAIGRVFAGNGGSPIERTSAPPVAHAAIPSGLQGGSPIAGAVPSSIAEPPRQRRAKPASGFEARRTTTSSQAFAGETTSTEASSGTQPESASAQASEPSRASTGTGSSGSKPSPARTGGGSGASGSGGSFDSSE
jgi:hypothetical protein